MRRNGFQQARATGERMWPRVEDVTGGRSLERFVRVTAPTGKLDFAFKLFVFLLICGALNHMRDVLQHGFEGRNTFFDNFIDATFTALPMCSFALLLIGHLNSLQKRLYGQATRDLLTGLHNRRWFMENAPDVLQPDQALLIVDVDHFKRINDSFGHDAGDRCLQDVANYLLTSIRSTDYCARIGGEEFAILLHDVSPGNLHRIAERISAGFSFVAEDGVDRQITASVGVAFDSAAQSRAEAFMHADKAVYSAKARGRACYVMATSADASGPSLAIA